MRFIGRMTSKNPRKHRRFCEIRLFFRKRISLRLRFLRPLPFLENGSELTAVGGDELLLHLGSAHQHRHFVVVGTDQCLSALELGDAAYLRAGELQCLPHILGFVRLQIEDDLGLAVVDDGPAVFAVLKGEEVG